MARPKFKRISKRCLFCSARLEAASYKKRKLHVVRCPKCKSDVSGPLSRRVDVEHAMANGAPQNA